MINNDSLHTLLINCRNNQELYIKNKWQLAYFTFLLYAAIIYASKLIGLGNLIFILLEIALSFCSIWLIYKFDRDIERHQDTAEKIYDKFPHMRKIIGGKKAPKRLDKVSKTLIVCVFIGMLVSVSVLHYMYSDKNEHFLQQNEKLEKKIDQCLNTLEQIKVDNTIYKNINTINIQLSKLSKRIDKLKTRIGEINTTVQLPKNAKSQGK